MARSSTVRASQPATNLPAFGYAIIAAALVGLVWMLVATLNDDGGEACPADADCVTVHTESGAYLFTVEWAVEPAERSCGLMFREEMAADHGMVFDFQEDRAGISFWMRNTLIPLDMIFIRATGEVVNVAENTTPLSDTGVPAAGLVRYVLELNGGTAARIGLEAGDTVDLARAPGRTGGTAICFPPVN
jgi:uncharacterized membrane protein (UPF0127 family)